MNDPKAIQNAYRWANLDGQARRELLSQNLRYICSHHGSVADICRKLKFNRQQFNKYLSGASFPSNRNLMRISSFFRVEPEDLLLRPQEFRSYFHSISINLLLSNDKLHDSFFSSSRDSEEEDRYCGIYKTYHKVPYAQKSILVGLSQIRRTGSHLLTKYLDFSGSSKGANGPASILKMNGTMTLDGGHLYMLDHMTRSNLGYHLTILYPSRRDPIDILTGMTMGVSQHLNGSPYASNILFKRLTPGTSLKEIARQCGFHLETSQGIPDEVKGIISNKIRESQNVLSHHFF